MEIYLSENLRNAIPDLEEEFREVHSFCRSLDSFIRTRGLFVYGRCSRYYDSIAGHTHADTHTMYPRFPWHGDIIRHPAGKITFSVGVESSAFDRTRLFAHELRHVGQMHRGKQKHGYLTFEHVNGHCEADAINFEEKVVKVYERRN